MRREIFAICVAVGLAFVLPARADDAPRDFFLRGVVAEGRLWLLSDDGRLVSLGETERQARPEALPEPVSDICRVDGSLVALSGTKGQPSHVRRRIDERWTDVQTIDLAEDDSLVGMACDGHSITVLSRNHLYDVSDHPGDVALNGKLGRGVLTVFAMGGQVYVGSNAGEFGGRLQAVDRTTGDVSDGQPQTARNCTLLCDDITGFSTLPWRPDCLAVTSGMIHFFPSGGVYTLCPGEKAQSLYSKPADGFVGKDGKPFGTVAFYGVVPDGDDLLMAGMDGLYRLGRDGSATIEPLPKFKAVGDIRVSFALPNVILVQTEIYRHTSVSGPVPLMIPR